VAKFISDIHTFINFLTGKGQTGYHSPEEIDNAVHEASLDLFNDLIRLFENSGVISDDLSPFMVGPTALTLTVGSAPKPANYKHCIAITAGTNEVEVSRIDHGMLANKRNDPLCPPTADYPICAFYPGTIQFYPTTLANVKLTYFKTPTKAVWAYTIVSDRFVYDDTNSVDIEWKENLHPKIRSKAMEFLGINLREGELVEYAQIKKREV
jgi:hypothetical protein